MANPVLAQLVDAAITIQAAQAIAIGDLIGINTSGEWVLADASTPSMFAQFVAIEDGVRAGAIYEVKVSKRAYFSDADFPYTAGGRYYLSETAGAHTATRPTTDGALIQIVGRAISTSVIYIGLETPKLQTVFVPPSAYDTTGEPGLGITDAGWAGPSPDATNGEIVLTQPFRVPGNAIGSAPVNAKLVFNSIGASGATIAITSVGAYDGASNVQATDTASTTDWEQADTDNILLTVVVTTVMDAMWAPGRNIQVKVTVTTITGDALFLGMWLEYEVAP